MDNQFAPYEESLELKELGFNEECLATYIKHENRDFRLDIQEQSGLHWSSVTNSELIGKHCTAPLYQQAFRWFREKHNIRIGIDYRTNDKDGYLYNISWEEWANGENPPVLVWHHRNSWLGANEPLTSYEEAELACLKKLIEIVKNK